MKFLFNLIFYSLAVIVLLPILAYAPGKVLTFFGILFGVCIIIGVSIAVYKIKHK